MEKNVLNLLQRDEVFAKIKPFLSSCPSKEWLMDHLTTFEPTPTSSFYCIYSGHTVYKLTPASQYNGKEDFLNDIFDRWVKAVNNGEFSVRTLVQGKKDYRQLITIEDEGNGVWVEKDAPQERVSISFIGVPSSFGRA